MVYVGASAVIVQSMLSGSANVAGFGGPAVVTNVLRGGDIIQVAAMAPYFTQSLVVRSDIRDLRELARKEDRHYPLRLGHRLRDKNDHRAPQPQGRKHPPNGRLSRKRSPGCRAVSSTAPCSRRRTTFACSKKAFANWSRRKICALWAAVFLTQGIVARQILRRHAIAMLSCA